MFGGLALGSVETDEDFAVMEGDDVRRCGIVEELSVDAGDIFVGHEGNFDLGEGMQVALR